MCHKTYSLKHHLQRHVKDKHLLPVFACKCAAVFSRPELLKRHISTCVSFKLMESNVMPLQNRMVAIGEKFYQKKVSEKLGKDCQTHLKQADLLDFFD